jgi:hypothetical protein
LQAEFFGLFASRLIAVRRALAAACLACVGCGGGVPLMHSAHATPKGDITFGAGFSGTMLVAGLAASGAPADVEIVKNAGPAPGIAPWVGARVGFGQGFDGGLSYYGRSVRLDARKSFELPSSWAVSLSLAGSGILPQRRKDLDLRVGGFGGDVPLLIGWKSRAEIYSIWLGARGGGELLNGERALPPEPGADLAAVEAVKGWHAWTGGVFGMRIGFRYVYAVLEVDAAMHWAHATLADRPVDVRQFGVAPAGALVAKF